MKDTKKLTLYTTRAALIAALYVALTSLATAVGMSSGVIQFRISEALCILPIFFPEALCILPIFFPEAIPGLFVGCFISNLLVPGAVIWDIIFGSLATLIGAVGTRMLKGLPEKYKWAATLPTILANVIIIPPVLIFAYGASDSFWFLMLTVGIGEIACAGVLGSSLYYVLRKYVKRWLK